MTATRNKSHLYFHTPPANLNCAQAILKGFQSEFNISDKEIEDYRFFFWGGVPKVECVVLCLRSNNC